MVVQFFVGSIFSKAYECEIAFPFEESSDRVDGAKANLISPSPATEYSMIIG